MPKKFRAKKEPEIVVIHSDNIPPLTAEEIARYKALPDGTPDAESPEFGQGRRVAAWEVQPKGRPSKGKPGNESAVISLRLPVSLRTAVAKRAKTLHVSFNAAMQQAAAEWATKQSKPTKPSKIA